MKSIVKGGGLMAAWAALLLAGCGSVDGKRDGGRVAAGPTPAPAGEAVVDGPPKLGAPFTVAGTTYTPADVNDYDDVGYASWYGEELAGSPTAIGEPFNLSLPPRSKALVPLPHPLPVNFTTLEEKFVGRAVHSGQFTALSETEADLTSEISLPMLCNIKITPASADLQNPAGEIYGKVIAAQNGCCRVRFTSVSPQLKSWLADRSAVSSS